MNPEVKIYQLEAQIERLKEKQSEDAKAIEELQKDSAEVHKLMNRGAGAFVALAGLGLIIGWFLATGKDLLSIWRAK